MSFYSDYSNNPVKHTLGKPTATPIETARIQPSQLPTSICNFQQCSPQFGALQLPTNSTSHFLPNSPEIKGLTEIGAVLQIELGNFIELGSLLLFPKGHNEVFLKRSKSLASCLISIPPSNNYQICTIFKEKKTLGKYSAQAEMAIEQWK